MKSLSKVCVSSAVWSSSLIVAYAFERFLDGQPVDLYDGEARTYALARGLGPGSTRSRRIALDAAHGHSDRGARRAVAIEAVLGRIDPRVRIAQPADHLPQHPIKLRVIAGRFGLRAENLALQPPIDPAIALVVIIVGYRAPDLIEDFEPVFAAVGAPAPCARTPACGRASGARRQINEQKSRTAGNNARGIADCGLRIADLRELRSCDFILSLNDPF